MRQHIDATDATFAPPSFGDHANTKHPGLFL
jgi:hypothetical protein